MSRSRRATSRPGQGRVGADRHTASRPPRMRQAVGRFASGVVAASHRSERRRSPPQSPPPTGVFLVALSLPVHSLCPLTLHPRPTSFSPWLDPPPRFTMSAATARSSPPLRSRVQPVGVQTISAWLWCPSPCNGGRPRQKVRTGRLYCTPTHARWRGTCHHSGRRTPTSSSTACEYHLPCHRHRCPST